MKNSAPVGPKLTVTFVNESKNPINIYWIDRKGTPVLFFALEPGKSKPQLTRKDATWLITYTNDEVAGHVRVKDKNAKVVITR